MPSGIIIFGSPGAGKTTLGRAVARELGFSFFDIDDYVWRTDTPVPFSSMYPREQKISRLMTDISRGERFVMAGSMDSFHTAFDPLFELAVLLTADTALRLGRCHGRECARFAERVLEGGDMYDNHLRFLDNVARYDADGSPNLATHTRWAESLRCPVLRLDGDDDVAENCRLISAEYRRGQEKRGDIHKDVERL